VAEHGFENLKFLSAGTLHPIRSLCPSLLAQNLMFRADKAHTRL
jgi:hypothetical protein